MHISVTRVDIRHICLNFTIFISIHNFLSWNLKICTAKKEEAIYIIIYGLLKVILLK